MMRYLLSSILVSGAILAASPAMAESFDTKYPVCMQVFASSGPRMDCYFWSMEQCWPKTDGMAALCVPNQNYVPSPLGARHLRESPRY